MDSSGSILCCADCRSAFFSSSTRRSHGGEVVSINGQINPLITMRPGEMQFWRIAHIGASLVHQVPHRGHGALCRRNGWPSAVAAAQGVRVLHRPGRADRGDRGRSAAGEYAMRTIPFQNEAWRPPEAVRDLARDRIGRRGGADGDAESEISAPACEGAPGSTRCGPAPIARRGRLTYSTNAGPAGVHDRRPHRRRRSRRSDSEARRHRGMDGRSTPTSNITASISIRRRSW